jgi:hypothetical protein
MNSNRSFIFVHQKLNNCSLFDALHMAEDKSSILNQIQHKPLGLPSCTPGQFKLKEQRTRWDKFCLKLTSSVQGTFVEASLSEHPSYV